MGKLLAGVGFGLVLSSVQPALAQDPFAVQSYERSTGSSKFLEVPSDPPEPIIQSIPLAQRERMYNEKPLTSRPKNAHVRTVRTPAQEFIHQRAVFHAQQRTQRMEQRKWRGESLLRPSNPSDAPWIVNYELPLWYSAHK
jgi:hypothetical protein